MVDRAAAADVDFRPHFKTHRSREVGRWFRDFGVAAITVSSVDMAQYFSNDGWDDITIAFPAVPTLMTALLQHPEYSKADLPELRLVNNVAPPDTLKAFQRALPDHARQVSAYGLTEATGTLDEKGFARIDGIEPGTCQVCFPDIDEEAWESA